MHLRKYSSQYLIDAILYFAFIISILAQEYFQFQNVFVSAFEIGFIFVYPAKYILAAVNLKTKSFAILAVLCLAAGLATIEFLGMTIALVGSMFDIPLFTRDSVLVVVTITVFLFMIVSRDIKIPSIKVDQVNYLYLSILLVAVSCLGSILMNQYQSNIVNLAFWGLVLIASSILVLEKGLTLQSKMIMIFAISLSCLLNITLISSFLTGWDIFYEYSVGNMTISQGVWNIDLGSNVNAMLSIAVLAPAISWIGNIDLLWVLKLVYPVIYALVPIGVFVFASRMTNQTAGVIGALLFILIQGFLFEMPSIARQEIAELFLITILLVAMLDDFSKYQKASLGILFGFGLITSHYATTLLFIGLLTLYYVVRLVFRAKEKPIFSGWHLLTLVVMELTWLLYIGSKGVLGSVLEVVDSVYNAVVNEFSITSSVVADRVSAPASLLHQVGKGIFILVIATVALGILVRLYKRRKGIDNYTALLVAFGVLMVVALTASNFLVLFSDIRMISLLLIVLGVMFYYGLSWILSLPLLRTQKSKVLYIAAALIAVYLIFNSGLAYQITNDGPTSIALDNNLIFPEFSNSEIKQAMWVQDNLQTGQLITADQMGRNVVGGFGWFNIDRDNKNITHVDHGELIYLTIHNIEQMKFVDATAGTDKRLSLDTIWKYPIVYCTESSRAMYVY
jgi:uncharacterized membrane protein